LGYALDSNKPEKQNPDSLAGVDQQPEVLSRSESTIVIHVNLGRVYVALGHYLLSLVIYEVVRVVSVCVTPG
jgi:hypothetical protein